MKNMTEARSMSGAKIELNTLTKRYPQADHSAVDGVDLVIEPGEFISFLGPSGSGKTTTLNMIAGLEQPTSGSVLFDDVDVSGRPAHKRNIGMVFQNYALFPHLSVGSNVAFPLKRRNVKGAELKQRVQNALALVGLAGYGDRKPDQLSGGQRQRVALARALVYEPSILLMDEPLGALDKSLRGQLQGEIRRLHQRLGVTVIFVTHDQGEALSMSDRIAIFNEGKVHQLGTGDELYRQPKDLFVTNFLGGANTIPFAQGASLATNAATSNQDKGAFVIVRPENVTVGPADARAISPGQKILPATVTDFINLGDTFEVTVQVEGIGELQSKMLSRYPVPFEVGSVASVSISTDDVVVVSS
jgi:putative spermidine/putrescine transport system ATP-binding protein